MTHLERRGAFMLACIVIVVVVAAIIARERDAISSLD
jgi:hypothetical protein